MRSRSVRMTDIKVGQTFRLLKGGERRRVTMKGGYENDVYILNPITHEVEFVPTFQAWDTTVKVEIPSRWTRDLVGGESYFLNDDPNYGPDRWRMYYHHTAEAWFLRKGTSGRLTWTNNQIGFGSFDNAEVWANEIVDDLEKEDQVDV